MPENPMPEDDKSDLRRVMQGAEAIDSIKEAQEYLAEAGGFDATLDSLDELVEEIRTDTGYARGEADDES